MARKLFTSRSKRNHLRKAGGERHILIGGDSIANRVADVGDAQTAFINTLSKYGLDATVYDGAQGGKGMADYIDFSTYAKGASFTALWETNNPTGPDKYTDIIYMVSANDIGEITGAVYTHDEWRDAGAALADLAFATFPKLQTFSFSPPTRHIGDNNASSISAWDGYRRVIPEIPALVTGGKSFLMGSNYHLPIPSADNVHPTDAAAETMGEQWATTLAYEVGKSGLQARSMEIIDMENGPRGVIVTVQHIDGHDIVVPDDPDLDHIYVEYNSSEVTITDIEKISSNKFLLVTGGQYLGDVEVTYVYGTCYGVDAEDPEIVLDNTLLGMPVARKEMTSTFKDPDDLIANLENLYTYLNPEYDKTLSGTEVTSIHSVNGRKLIQDSAGLTWDETAHNGNGGFAGLGGACALTTRGNHPWTAGSDLIAGITITVPETISAGMEILSFGRNTSYGDGRSRLYCDNLERLIHYSDSVDAATTFIDAGDFSDDTFFILFDKDGDDLILTWDSASGNVSGTTTITQFATWPGVTDIFFGGNGASRGVSSDFILGKSFVAVGGLTGNDSSASELIAYMKSSQGYS